VPDDIGSGNAPEEAYSILRIFNLSVLVWEKPSTGEAGCNQSLTAFAVFISTR
jgi:hypothetical protein